MIFVSLHGFYQKAKKLKNLPLDFFENSVYYYKR